jgi:hypothetical protein
MACLTTFKKLVFIPIIGYFIILIGYCVAKA